MRILSVSHCKRWVMGRDCSKHKKGGFNKLPCLSSVVNPLSLHLCTLLLILTMCFCGGIWESLCPLIVPSHAPEPPSLYTHTHTHRGQGERNSFNSASCTLFHLVPMNGPWIQAWNLSKDPCTNTHICAHTHSSPHSEKCLCICSSCLPHLLKLSDSAFVRWRGRVPHYGGHCGCASFRGSWGGKPTHCGIEHHVHCTVSNDIRTHSVLTHAHADTDDMKHIPTSWRPTFQGYQSYLHHH